MLCSPTFPYKRLKKGNIIDRNAEAHMVERSSQQVVFMLEAKNVIFPAGTNFVTLFINNQSLLFEITSVAEKCYRGFLEDGQIKTLAELKQLRDGEAYCLLTYPQNIEMGIISSGHTCYICTHTGELLPEKYCERHQFVPSETTDLINLQSINACVDFFNSIMNIIKRIRNFFPKKVF